MRRRSQIQRMWYGVAKSMVRVSVSIAFRTRYSGSANVPRTGGALLVSNHQSHLDPMLVGMGSRRRMNYVARKTLFQFGPFGWLLRSVDAIPIDRDGFGLGGIKESLRRLKNGEMVLIFPEGTRSADGEIAPFRPGFTTLAVRSGAAILPAAVDGAFQVWPRSKKFPGLGRIRVHYGKMMTPDDIAGRSDRELVAEVERRVRECRALLRNQSHP